jgi:hypothetical protein
MLWTFHRDGAFLHYEIRQAFDKEGYEFVVRHPDGREECEQFSDSESLNKRALELQKTLLDGGWFLAGDPRR